jgi:hypothetical protein
MRLLEPGSRRGCRQAIAENAQALLPNLIRAGCLQSVPPGAQRSFHTPVHRCGNSLVNDKSGPQAAASGSRPANPSAVRRVGQTPRSGRCLTEETALGTLNRSSTRRKADHWTHEEDVPTPQPQAVAYARFPQAHAHPRRPRSASPETPQRSAASRPLGPAGGRADAALPPSLTLPLSASAARGASCGPA